MHGMLGMKQTKRSCARTLEFFLHLISIKTQAVIFFFAKKYPSGYFSSPKNNQAEYSV
jgi:hypothetical protein